MNKLIIVITIFSISLFSFGQLAIPNFEDLTEAPKIGKIFPELGTRGNIWVTPSLHPDNRNNSD